MGEQDLITLLDEDGAEHEFSLVDILDVDQRRYAVLQPVVGGEESEAAVIFRMEEDDTLITIEDDADFERVRQAFEAAETSEATEEDPFDLLPLDGGGSSPVPVGDREHGRCDERGQPEPAY